MGYWIASAHGLVRALGDAPPADTNENPQAPPVVSAQATPSGNGLWLLQRDGTVRAFGDATVATLPDAANSSEELMHAADAAMYLVKDSGKNGIYIAFIKVV